MPNWHESMQQTYEYYIVDPNTWCDSERINTVITSSIDRDSEASTLGSATVTMTESIGERYIRIYLVTIQNGIMEKFALGTFLAQTPSTGFDGKVYNYDVDAYTPLLELKEKMPPFGYSIMKDENIMDMAYKLVKENVRAPVVQAQCDTKLYDHFVTNGNETWLDYTSDLMTQAKYVFALDEMGRILFQPQQDIAALQPVWTYTDDNSSILYPEITIDRDLYDIPNVVEVVYSNEVECCHVRVVNDDENSPVSTVNRGREKVHRVLNPDLIGNPTNNRLKEYAEQTLKALSSIDCTISYKHGYCPVVVNDCVRLNYEKAGIVNVKAKVISQNINCVPGCPVTERAVFTTNLWR